MRRLRSTRVLEIQLWRVPKGEIDLVERSSLRDSENVTGCAIKEAMRSMWKPFERVSFVAQYLSPRPRKVRQITRIVMPVILLIGFLRDAPWELLVLTIWVGIYVELMMRNPNELGGRPW